MASNLLALVLADQDDLAKQARRWSSRSRISKSIRRTRRRSPRSAGRLFRLGRWDDAERMLRQAMATGRLNADGAYFVAKMFDREGKAREAKTLLAKALATKHYFAYQEDAEQLLARLGAEAPLRTAIRPRLPRRRPKRGSDSLARGITLRIPRNRASSTTSRASPGGQAGEGQRGQHEAGGLGHGR